MGATDAAVAFLAQSRAAWAAVRVALPAGLDADALGRRVAHKLLANHARLFCAAHQRFAFTELCVAARGYAEIAAAADGGTQNNVVEGSLTGTDTTTAADSIIDASTTDISVGALKRVLLRL